MGPLSAVVFLSLCIPLLGENTHVRAHESGPSGLSFCPSIPWVLSLPTHHPHFTGTRLYRLAITTDLRCRAFSVIVPHRNSHIYLHRYLNIIQYVACKLKPRARTHLARCTPHTLPSIAQILGFPLEKFPVGRRGRGMWYFPGMSASKMPGPTEPTSDDMPPTDACDYRFYRRTPVTGGCQTPEHRPSAFQTDR